MVDLGWKANMVSSDKTTTKSPKLIPTANLSLSLPLSFRSSDISTASPSSCSSYDHYLRLNDLRKLWSSKEFPEWTSESVLKPGLQALEITFRFISIVLSDPRPYVNRWEWKRKLESLTTSQIQLIAMIFEDDEEDDEARGRVPIVDLSSSNGVITREGSSAEVWKIRGEATVVSRTSELSLLPRLASWQSSEDIAQMIQYSVECEMRRCPYTLGLGEPNLVGKPNIDYDQICRPNELHSLRKSPYDQIENYENQTVYTTHQILESWIYAAHELLKRIAERIEMKNFARAAKDCYLMERIWKVLQEIEDLHLLMDPDDFLKLKNQLAIKSLQESEAFCFRSTTLVEITKQCKDLKHKVPFILDVEVDPMGGPRIQEAAMRLYSEKREIEKIHLLQALQSIESAIKKFFFAYKQVLVMVMGSLEAKGNRVVVSSNSDDSLSQIFLESTYFPSLDAAKTFLGDMHSVYGSDRRTRMKL
ncbi:nematode resistance protein-like HSPRO2 [Cucurbita moschata]|uniref:Nematode resistance protein-like HSPRO2 n=1 Tax=Cucurbita moschata TaxID=3662 RepID=A0A6J1FFX0_CUCMO|nr:nematode resistance protein-like HSPRO2 [Cucurbita moschata]